MPRFQVRLGVRREFGKGIDGAALMGQDAVEDVGFALHPCRYGRAGTVSRGSGGLAGWEERPGWGWWEPCLHGTPES